MQAKRVDKNHPEILATAEKLGFSVQSLHVVGKNCPDAIFGYDGLNIYCEIKSDKNDLSEGQKKYHEEWKGQICTVWNIDDLMIEYLRYSYRVYGKIRMELIELIIRYRNNVD